MMQPAENRFADNPAIILNRTVDWGILPQRHMCSADIVIIVDVFMQNIMQMSFVENDHTVKTFSA